MSILVAWALVISDGVDLGTLTAAKRGWLMRSLRARMSRVDAMLGNQSA